MGVSIYVSIQLDRTRANARRVLSRNITRVSILTSAPRSSTFAVHAAFASMMQAPSIVSVNAVIVLMMEALAAKTLTSVTLDAAVWVRVETMLAPTSVPACARWVSTVSAVAAWTLTNAHVTPVYRENSAETRVVVIHAHAAVVTWMEVKAVVMILMSVQSMMGLAPTHALTIKADTHADVRIGHSKLATVIVSVRQMVLNNMCRITLLVTNEAGNLAQ